MNLRKSARYLLLMIGTLSATYISFISICSIRADRVGQQFGTVHAAAQTAKDAVSFGPGKADETRSTVIGRLEIRDLQISVPILSDYEPNSLLKGVGHVPGTAMPGGLGTLGLAGHRDTYFRPLKGIRKDMDIRVADKSGVYHYRVDSTEIVNPEQVEVLAIGSRPELTLITCYPFNFIGSAPQRFIVHAHLLSLVAD